MTEHEGQYQRHEGDADVPGAQHIGDILRRHVLEQGRDALTAPADEKRTTTPIHENGRRTDG
jgi:hypothetical protein